MKKTEDIPRGQLPTIILSTLLENDKYGYEIINDVAEKTNGKVAIKQPSLYSCLRRMEEQSLISSYWRDSEIGGRRHYYRITDYGKKYVEKWQTTDVFSNATEKNVTLEDKAEKSETDNNQPVFLEQTNLFRDSTYSPSEQKEETKTEENQIVDNSFIQYDLFNTTNIITKPSVEVFETIKEKEVESQEKNIEENQPLQDDRIAMLRKTQENADKEPINIKQEFFLLNKKQKSFTESYKEDIASEDDSVLYENNLVDEKFEINNLEQQENANEMQMPVFSFDKQSEEQEQSVLGIDLSDEKEETNIEHSPTFIDLNDEAPTIYKSTTEFIEEEQVLEEPKVVEDVEPDDNIIKIENDKQSAEQKQTSAQQKLDDAVFITEKADPESTPKVRKISTTRFEHFNVDTGNSIIDKYIEQPQMIQENLEEQKEDDYVVSQPQVKEIYDYSSCVNYEQLTQYYGENGIMFSAYKKMPKSMKPSNAQFIKKNKFSLITSLSLAIFAILETLIFGLFITKSQGGCWVLYVLTSLAFAGYFVYNLLIYLKDKNRLAPKSSMQEFNPVYISLITLIGILVIFSINLLCGMNFHNIGEYSISFIYLSVSMLNFPILSLIRFIFNKTKIFNA